MTSEINIKHAGYFFFIIFALSVCISKAAVNISGSVLLLLSIIYLILFYDRIDFRYKNRYVLIILFPFFIGFISSFFALSGVSGSLAFLERFRFFLLFLPFALFIDSQKKINTVFIMLNLSSFSSVVYGITFLDFTNIWGMTVGFHTIGRSSDLMVAISLMNIAWFFIGSFQNKTRNILFKLAISLNTLLMVSGVAVMGRRGSLIGLLVGIIVLLLVFRRFLILVLIMGAVCCSLYFSDNWVTQRVRSISALDKQESNIIRIQVVRTGVDYLIDKRLFFRGTGAKKSEKTFGAYYNSMPKVYKKKYDRVSKYFGNFHNSFLQMAIEAGALFVILFLSSVLYLMVFLFKKVGRLEGDLRFYPAAALAVTTACFASQFFHGDLYMYGGIPFILILSGACVVCVAEPGGYKISDEDSTSSSPVLFGPNGPILQKTVHEHGI